MSDQMDPTLREWLYAREVLRRLGFGAAEIFFVVAPSGRVKDRDTGVITECDRPLIGIEIQRGGRTFSWPIGGTNLSVEQIQPAYEAAIEAWNAGDEAVFPHDEFLASRPARHSIQLMMALRAKGFELGKYA